MTEETQRLEKEFHEKFHYTMYDHPDMGEIWEWIEKNFIPVNDVDLLGGLQAAADYAKTVTKGLDHNKN